MTLSTGESTSCSASVTGRAHTGLDTFEADVAVGHREDGRGYAAAQLLRAVGARRMRLLSNDPGLAMQRDACGIGVTEPAVVLADGFWCRLQLPGLEGRGAMTLATLLCTSPAALVARLHQRFDVAREGP
jgi:hypothetical protein